MHFKFEIPKIEPKPEPQTSNPKPRQENTSNDPDERFEGGDEKRQTAISTTYSRLAESVTPTNPDNTSVESETLHNPEVVHDYNILFKLLDILTSFHGKKQRSPSEVSRFTGIDESEVREILDDCYLKVTLSPGIGDQYWMSERDINNFQQRILGPAVKQWEKDFPGQKILCPPAVFNLNMESLQSKPEPTDAAA